MRWLPRIVLLLILLVAFYAGTAVVSLKALVHHAQSGDAAEVMARVDLPRLKRSLADQIIRAYFARVTQTRPVKAVERIAAPTVVDLLVASLLTPENIAVVLKSGVLRTAESGDAAAITLPSLRDAGLESTVRILTRLRPKSFVQLQILLDDAGQAAIRLHFEGTHWKLSGIDLPPPALEKLIASIPSR